MAKIRWSDEAAVWLRDIHDYIARDNPAAAGRTVIGIYEKVQFLERHPELGHRYHVVAERNIRILLYGHYRVVYLLKADGDIDILGVFHGAMDIDRYLR